MKFRDEKYFNVDNYEFKFFLEGFEMPVTGIRVQVGDGMNFAVDIAPSDFSFEPFCWGIVLVKENNNPWKVLCSGIYTGDGVSKTLSSKKYTLNFRSVYQIFKNMVFYDLIEGGKENAGFARETMLFFSGEEGYLVGDSNEHMPLKLFLETKMNEKIKLKGLIGFLDLVFGTPVNNVFSKKHLENFKFNIKNIKVIENKKINETLKKNFLNIASNMFKSESSISTIDQTIMKVFKLFKYNMYYIPSLNKGLEEFTIKPDMHVSIPPACNVMFPHETFSYNYNKDFSKIPTRYRFSGNIDQNSMLTTHYAPKELVGMIKDDSGDKFLLEEEKYRGIVPSMDDFSYFELLPTGATQEEGSGIKARNSLSKYMYNEKRHSSIGVSVNCKLKLGMLPGFCGAILDSPNSLIGHVNSVSHFIDLESSTAGTSVSMGFVKKDNVSIPFISGWYDDELFMPDKIGKNIFEEFGTGTYYKGPPQVDGDEVNLKRSLDELYEEYLDANAISQVQKFKRETPDAIDFLEHLGLEWDGQGDITGVSNEDLFGIEIGDIEVSKERRKSVKKYLKNVKGEFAHGSFGR